MPRRQDRRPPLASPEPMQGVVRRVGRLGAGPGGRPTVSREDWEACVGARIADRAQPVELDRGTLVVRTATNVWASELTLLAVTIVERLKARGIDVRALRCRVGPVEPRPLPKALRPSVAVPAPTPLPAPLARALEAVDDPDLRATIAAAASANLAWQDYVDAHGTGPTTSASRGARVPQSAGTETGLPGRTTGATRGAPRRTP